MLCSHHFLGYLLLSSNYPYILKLHRRRSNKKNEALRNLTKDLSYQEHEVDWWRSYYDFGGTSGATVANAVATHRGAHKVLFPEQRNMLCVRLMESLIISIWKRWTWFLKTMMIFSVQHLLIQKISLVKDMSTWTVRVMLLRVIHCWGGCNATSMQRNICSFNY